MNEFSLSVEKRKPKNGNATSGLDIKKKNGVLYDVKKVCDSERNIGLKDDEKDHEDSVENRTKPTSLSDQAFIVDHPVDRLFLYVLNPNSNKGYIYTVNDPPSRFTLTILEQKYGLSIGEKRKSARIVVVAGDEKEY